MIAHGAAPCDAGVLQAGASAAAPCPERARRWVLAASIIGSGMAFLDGSVVNVALPALQAELGVSIRSVQWVVNAYLLMLGALMLVGGSAGDRFGRRRVFVIGIVVFTLASVACGLAPDAEALVFARAVQGVGGALLVPNSLALISAAYPKNERGRAIGTWAGFSALTTALGPVLGGWLVDAFTWRAIFFVNVPVAVVALAAAFLRVPEFRSAAERAPIDGRGALLATSGLGALCWGLTDAAERGWSNPAVLAALAAGVLLLAAFVWSQRVARAPMMPLALFSSRNFSGANAMTLLLYCALSGALFFLPFNLIRLQGYSATAAGAAFLPLTLMMGSLSRWSGGLVARYGARPPLIVGPVIAAVGFALLAAPAVAESYWTSFFPAMIVLGLGMTISVAPLTTVVMSSVDDRHAGTASGINNAVARIAGVLAVALLGAIAVGVFTSSLEARIDALRIAPEVRAAIIAQAPALAEARVPEQVQGFARHAVQFAYDAAFLHGFRVVMLVACALALASALCAAGTIERGK
ncbi:MAG: MFS transporter [Burkholderiaceae bacterium]|nr:MFS transporter [Burkholderiaceae bacterium]